MRQNATKTDRQNKESIPEVEIKNKAQFRTAAKFAKSLGRQSFESFSDCLKTLNRIRRNNNYSMYIWPDFVQHSFNFSFYSSNGLQALNGGMILHGFGETFSIELVSQNFPHWSIHT